MEDASTPAPSRCTLTGMDLERWTDLDLAYLLAFGEHPDLNPQPLGSTCAAGTHAMTARAGTAPPPSA